MYNKEQVIVVFVLIAVIRSVIIVFFWFLSLSFLFWKDLT